MLNVITAVPAIANNLNDQLRDQIPLVEEVAKREKGKCFLMITIRDPEVFPRIEPVIHPDFKLSSPGASAHCSRRSSEMSLGHSTACGCGSSAGQQKAQQLMSIWTMTLTTRSTPKIIRRITDMGFAEAEAAEALRNSGGDVQGAVEGLG
jgi:hypothetical protein